MICLNIVLIHCFFNQTHSQYISEKIIILLRTTCDSCYMMHSFKAFHKYTPPYKQNLNSFQLQSFSKRESKKLRVHSNSKRIGCLTKKILILLSLIVHINQKHTFNSYFSPFNHQFTSKLINNQRYCLYIIN